MPNKTAITALLHIHVLTSSIRIYKTITESTENRIMDRVEKICNTGVWVDLDRHSFIPAKWIVRVGVDYVNN